MIIGGMAVCPNGHDSASDDICDACGVRIAPSASAAGRLAGRHRRGPDSYSWSAQPVSPPLPTPTAVPPPTAFPPPATLPPPAAVPPPATLPPPVGVTPPATLPPPAGATPPTAWTVLITPDRAYYERPQITVDLRGSAPPFPAYLSERRIRLAGAQVLIGRRSPARGLEPEIDLAGPPADPGVSRLHALLIPAPDGTWAVLDPGSANGTMLNGRQLVVGELVPLQDGDRINVGAWTAITVHRG
jgi:hypothetical protein